MTKWRMSVLLLLMAFISLRAIKLTRGQKSIINLASAAASLAIGSVGGGQDLVHGPLCGCCLVPAAAMIVPLAARAANLPSDTGASGKERGTLKALARVEECLRAAKTAEASAAAGGSLSDIRSGLNPTFALKEKGFKKMFDEYSEGISYKQQFLDKNAFLVYYSGGFDGPGRESIEKESPAEALQKAQYGYRNDAWVALDESMSELDYLIEGASEDRSDIKKDLKALRVALESFVNLAPQEQRAALNN